MLCDICARAEGRPTPLFCAAEPLVAQQLNINEIGRLDQYNRHFWCERLRFANDVVCVCVGRPANGIATPPRTMPPAARPSQNRTTKHLPTSSNSKPTKRRNNRRIAPYVESPERRRTSTTSTAGKTTRRPRARSRSPLIHPPFRFLCEEHRLRNEHLVVGLAVSKGVR